MRRGGPRGSVNGASAGEDDISNQRKVLAVLAVLDRPGRSWPGSGPGLAQDWSREGDMVQDWTRIMEQMQLEMKFGKQRDKVQGLNPKCACHRVELA
jgi:hypothetical protein